MCKPQAEQGNSRLPRLEAHRGVIERADMLSSLSNLESHFKQKGKKKIKEMSESRRGRAEESKASHPRCSGFS